MNITKADRADAIATLRKYLRAGDTIYTKCIHVSRSGMYRVIDVYIARGKEIIRLSYSVSAACGLRYDRHHEGIGIGGCGFSAGDSIVHDIGRVLYPKGFKCTGRNEHPSMCPSNEHSNGMQSYDRKHTHPSGGYAFHQRTM